MKKILITGGHPAPALALIDYIRQKNSSVEIVFAGRKYNNHYERSLSYEFKESKRKNIQFININAGRATRSISVSSLIELILIPIGFLQALFIVLLLKPDRIVSFGGYIALPFAIAGKITGRNVYTHEQTIHPGYANKLISKFATYTFVSFDESKQFFNLKKTIHTGNPLRNEIFNAEHVKHKVAFNLPSVLIIGGSLGSHSINSHIKSILPELLETCFVVHQTGNVKKFDDYQKMKEVQSLLPKMKQKRYSVYEHILGNEIGKQYQNADIVICRAGANTIFELLALKKPAILIPLPWSAHDEQRKHAQLFAKYQIGEVFEQTRPSGELLKCIRKSLSKLSQYEKNYSKVPHQYIQTKDQAPKKIYSIVFDQT